jgi:hypothetical protein
MENQKNERQVVYDDSNSSQDKNSNSGLSQGYMAQYEAVNQRKSVNEV